MAPLGALLTLATLLLCAVAVVTGSSLCEQAPPWAIDGVAPMATHSGNVTAVTLLQAS